MVEKKLVKSEEEKRAEAEEGVKRDSKVRFAGEVEEKKKVAVPAKKSVSSIMHSKPELYEF